MHINQTSLDTRQDMVQQVQTMQTFLVQVLVVAQQVLLMQTSLGTRQGLAQRVRLTQTSLGTEQVKELPRLIRLTLWDCKRDLMRQAQTIQTSLDFMQDLVQQVRVPLTL